MTGYWQANLKSMIEVRGEAEVKEELSRFLCPKNPDIESFLHDKAILFEKQGISATHLVYHSYKDSPVLVGYYALANKPVSIKGSSINSKWRKRLNRFAHFDPLTKQYNIALPLIGQLGKNYANQYDQLITGDILLGFACDKIKRFQLEMGGKMAYLECEDTPKLIEFYTRNGFYQFGHRNLDGDEIGHDTIHYLVQMLIYFSD